MELVVIHVFKCIIKGRAKLTEDVETRAKVDSSERIELERT